MTSSEIRQKYIEYFQEKGHAFVPSANIVPDNDPTTLFVSSGMQPLLPYLLGEKHPQGDRIVDSQICVRAHGFLDDVMDVGDNRHTTFFEMLGNWSLGSYFKEEQLSWVFDFLINVIKLDPNNIYVSTFSGDEEFQVGMDDESIEIWKRLFSEVGINAEYVELISEENGGDVGTQGGKIFGYDSKKNWWSRSGPPGNMPDGEPGGSTSEIFYDFGIEHDKAYGEYCHPNCDCGRFLEIGNSVFMEFLKENNQIVPLPQKNVDFGGGFERIVAAVNDDPDVFNIDLFKPIIKEIELITGKKYEGNESHMRVIADHLKTSTYLINANVIPSNKQQGYVLRKLLRRSVVKFQVLNPEINHIEATLKTCDVVTRLYSDIPEGFGFRLNASELKPKLYEIVTDEIGKFNKALAQGMKVFNKTSDEEINGELAFNLYQNFGFPYELTSDLAADKGLQVSREDFNNAFNEHRDKSKTDKIFKGGLGDSSVETTKLHTATHLLHGALRQVLGTDVQQMGSNITAERLRFDFSYGEKMTGEQKEEVQDIVNQKISEALPVNVETMTFEEAEKTGALHFFNEKYGESVKVYYIGESLDTAWSKEFCGGPHVGNTSELGIFKIKKEESVGKGVRRIKATLG